MPSVIVRDRRGPPRRAGVSYGARCHAVSAPSARPYPQPSVCCQGQAVRAKYARGAGEARTADVVRTASGGPNPGRIARSGGSPDPTVRSTGDDTRRGPRTRGRRYITRTRTGPPESEHMSQTDVASPAHRARRRKRRSRGDPRTPHKSMRSDPRTPRHGTPAARRGRPERRKVRRRPRRNGTNFQRKIRPFRSMFGCLSGTSLRCSTCRVLHSTTSTTTLQRSDQPPASHQRRAFASGLVAGARRAALSNTYT